MDRQVRVINTDFVTVETGTGAVHIAPGHGQDDFAAGLANDLPLENPVGGNGVYLPSTEHFAGQHRYRNHHHYLNTRQPRLVQLPLPYPNYHLC